MWAILTAIVTSSGDIVNKFINSANNDTNNAKNRIREKEFTGLGETLLSGLYQMGTVLGQMGTVLGQMGTGLGETLLSGLYQMGTVLGQMGTVLGQMFTSLYNLKIFTYTSRSSNKPSTKGIQPWFIDILAKFPYLFSNLFDFIWGLINIIGQGVAMLLGISL
jgi:hypothetical protein